jgi:transposase-like protein
MSDKPRPMPVAAASTDRSPYHGYRFPSEIMAHAVWLYFRFHLSFRDVQDLLAERGIVVSHEAICQWCTKFGAAFASGRRRHEHEKITRAASTAATSRPPRRVLPNAIRSVGQVES